MPLSKASSFPPTADVDIAQRSLCGPRARCLVISASRVTPARKCEFSLPLSPGFDPGGASADGAALSLAARASHWPVHCCFALRRPIHRVDRTLLTIPREKSSREKSGTEGSQPCDNTPRGGPTRHLPTNPKVYPICSRHVNCNLAACRSREF